MSYLKSEHQERVTDSYHALKGMEGFAKVASLADIRANDGNLSIPLYARGNAVGDEKGEHVADGLREKTASWEESSEHLSKTIVKLLSQLELH